MSISLEQLKFAEKMIAAEIKKKKAEKRKLETGSYPINFICQFEGTLSQGPEKSRSPNYPKADVISTTLKILIPALANKNGWDQDELLKVVTDILENTSRNPENTAKEIDPAVEFAMNEALKTGKAKFQAATPKTVVSGTSQAAGEVRIPTAKSHRVEPIDGLSEILNRL